jgi:hypothetical protein
MELLVRGNVGEIHECGYEMRKRVARQSKVHALHPLAVHPPRAAPARRRPGAEMRQGSNQHVDCFPRGGAPGQGRIDAHLPAGEVRRPNPVVRFVIGRFFRRLRAVLAELESPLRPGRRLRRGRDAAPRGAARRRARPSVWISPRLPGRGRRARPRLRVGARCPSPPAASTPSPAWKCWSTSTTPPPPCANWRAWPAAPWCFSVPFEPYFRIGNVLRGKHLGRLGNHPEHVQHWNLRTFPPSCRAGGRGADCRGLSLDHRLLPSKPTLIFLLLAAIGVARITATYRERRADVR